MSAHSPKDTKRQHKPQPQSVHPAAIWQNMQKYVLSYHQTTEQLHSSVCVRLLNSSVHHRKNLFLCSIKGLQLARVPLQHRSGRMYWSGIFHKSLSSVVILTVPFENIWLDSHKSALLKICLFHSLKHIIDNEDGFLIGCWKKCTHLQYLLLKSGPNEFVMKRPALG